MSNFGWTYLSRAALRQAEAQLTKEVEGVRDEIGFLTLHQRYADRFFPGTSVLHTRLRYVLFVPWTYLTLKRRVSERVEDAVQKKEVALAGRLREAHGGGVVGGNKYPMPMSQPPSVIYWTALGAWGLLRRRTDGLLPSRAYIHALLKSTSRLVLDDDNQPLSEIELPFIRLPHYPDNWHHDGEMDFFLTSSEATFLRERLIQVSSQDMPGRKCLLATLAEGQALRAPYCWSPEIISMAKEDGPVLKRAGDIASLAGIGRAIYAALVDSLREGDGQYTSRMHREYLPQVIEEHVRPATQVNLDDLVKDIGNIPTTLLEVLQSTLAWLVKAPRNIMLLRDVYEKAEYCRKNDRTRLAGTPHGRERRFEWNNEEHAYATPLHYRWDNVSRLLNDLWAAA